MLKWNNMSGLFTLVYLSVVDWDILIQDAVTPFRHKTAALLHLRLEAVSLQCCWPIRWKELSFTKP